VAVLLLGLFALGFGVAAVAILVVGFMATFGLGGIAGGVLGGILTIAVLALPLMYVTYLLGRSTWRIHTATTERTSRRSQRQVVGRVALVVGVTAIGYLWFPFMPTPVKVIAIVMPILMGVFVIAAELEPAKRKRPPQGG
jgi:hypothetical protein